MGKTLIVYYSFEGHTEKVAQILKNQLSADLLRIEPVHEREDKGFSKYIWGGASVFMKKEPALKQMNIDFSLYDILWIGTPVWAWTITPPILSFLKSGLIQNKHIVFFYTHDGGPGQIEKRFLKLLDPSNTLLGAIGFESIDRHLDEIEEKCQAFIQTLPNFIK